MRQTTNRCYVRMSENLQRKLRNLVNETLTLGERLMKGGKKMVKKNTNIPP